MRTFFYYIKKSACGLDCRWQVCSQRYLAKLRTINGLKDIHSICGEVAFISPQLETSPRNGDIIILYAENSQELDTMIAARNGFDGLKKILVVADSEGVNGDKYHMLSPRYITQAQRDIGELGAVVQKMTGQIH
jgi:hypothetical protein